MRQSFAFASYVWFDYKVNLFFYIFIQIPVSSQSEQESTYIIALKWISTEEH